MITFDTTAFEAALAQLARQVANPSTLSAAAVAGAEVLEDAIVTNIVALGIVDTGEYRDSWDTVPGAASATEAEAAAQSATSYGQHLEYGTRKAAARPAVRNAIDSPDVQGRVLEAEAGVLSRAMGT